MAAQEKRELAKRRMVNKALKLNSVPAKELKKAYNSLIGQIKEFSGVFYRIVHKLELAARFEETHASNKLKQPELSKPNALQSVAENLNENGELASVLNTMQKDVNELLESLKRLEDFYAFYVKQQKTALYSNIKLSEIVKKEDIKLNYEQINNEIKGVGIRRQKLRRLIENHKLHNNQKPMNLVISMNGGTYKNEKGQRVQVKGYAHDLIEIADKMLAIIKEAVD